MAVEKIRFELGSVFNGKGFEDANKAIERNNKTLSSATRGLGELSRAFGSIIPEVAEATGNVGGFINGFVTGGVVGGVISAALGFISDKIRAIGEEAAKLKEEIKVFGDHINESFTQKIEMSNGKFIELIASIKQTSAESKDLLQVLNGNTAMEAQNKIYEVKMRMYEKLDTSLTDAEKAIVRAAAEKEIALIRAAEAQKRATNQIEQLHQQESAANVMAIRARERQAEASAALAQAENENRAVIERRKALEERLTEINSLLTAERIHEVGTAENEKRLRLERLKILQLLKDSEKENADVYKLLAAATKAVEEAKKQEAAAAREQVKAQNALILAQQALTKAVQEGEISEREADLKLKEAKDKVTKALMAEADARHKLWEEEERKKQLQEAAIEDENRKRREEREKGKEEKKKPKASAGADAWANVKVEVDVDNVKINEGQVATFGEHQAQLREEARKSRYEFNEYKARFGNDFARYAQMLGKPDSWLSSRDRQLRDYMNNVVLKEMDSDLAARLFQDASKRVLLPSDLEKFLGNRSDVVKTLEKLKAR